MKVSCLFLLFLSLPVVLCRLKSQPKGQVDSDVHAEQQPQLHVLNLTNEISYFRGNGLQVIEVIEPQYDESPPEEFINATFDLLPTAMANVDSHRELQSTMEVVFENQCTTPFYFSIKYNQGNVTKGWYLLQYGQSVSFDVQGNQFAMYAITPDGTYRWGGEAGSAMYCDGNLNICYKDYTIDGSPTRSIHYLRCIGASNPEPSPTPSPTPPPPPDSNRAGNRRVQKWVDAHNMRRATLHTGLVSWHDGIAASAQNYASKLASIEGCVIQHGYQGDKYGGENLAANWGRSSVRQSPNEVLTRWFEEEANNDWPANGHWSQVGWRATTYIGCGEVSKSYQGGTCFIQVCRYITPGNCNVGSAPLLELMLRETSPCKPQSP